MSHEPPPLGHGYTIRDFLAPSSIVFLLFVGLFKTIPAFAELPTDLTIIAGGVVMTGLVVMAVDRKSTLRISVWALILVASFLPAALYHLTSPYAINKRLGMFLALLAATAAVYLTSTWRRQRVWVWAHVVLAIVLLAIAPESLDLATQRLAIGDNTIGTARLVGAALVVLLTLILTAGIRNWLAIGAALAISAWLAQSLIATGSRGPVLAAAISILVAMALAQGRGRLVRVGLSVMAVSLGWLMLAGSSDAGASRILMAVAGDDSSTAARIPYWHSAVSSIVDLPRGPFGLGWGNFSEALPSGLVSARSHPHNLVLEVFAEGGWITGTVVVAFIVLSLVQLCRRATDAYSSALFAIALFFVVNAMVSGDISDNRTMWAALAIGWVAESRPRVDDYENDLASISP